jgi:HEAT repeat protein
MEQRNGKAQGKESATSSALGSEEMRTKLAMAVNPNTPSKVLSDLAETAPECILERIAENPRASADTLSRLAAHCCAAVRVAVAENTNTVLDVLLELVQDESVDVRYSIAENHSMPFGILESLIDDENPYVSMRARKTLARLVENNVRHGRFKIGTTEVIEPKFQTG